MMVFIPSDFPDCGGQHRITCCTDGYIEASITPAIYGVVVFRQGPGRAASLGMIRYFSAQTETGICRLRFSAWRSAAVKCNLSFVPGVRRCAGNHRELIDSGGGRLAEGVLSIRDNCMITVCSVFSIMQQYYLPCSLKYQNELQFL